MADEFPGKVPLAVRMAYQEEFSRFAKEFENEARPGHSIVFYGSSSIRLWGDLKEHFPEFPVLNRGFGGSTMAECAALFEMLVVPLHPMQLVLYAGDNDLAGGAYPMAVLSHARALLVKRERMLPAMRVLLISVKPSPSRAHLVEAMRATNAGLCRLAVEFSGCEYLDVFSSMIDAKGRPRHELFCDDLLHMNENGYALWREKVAPRLLSNPATPH